jgi:hypothetical protein
MTSSRARIRCRRLTALAALAGLITAGCGTSQDGSSSKDSDATRSTSSAPAVIDPGDGGHYQPTIDPANFVDVIDNPYMPWKTGSRWLYEGAEGNEKQRVEVAVKPERKMIMGVNTVSVQDEVFHAGSRDPIEITTDWYAQDKAGNVWYFGEDTKEYENGKVSSTKGTWTAGVKGALPGIIMLASPRVGKAYRQEYAPGEAEDMAQVVRTDASVTVKAGRYDKVVVTKEWTPLEPKVVEEKSYAPTVGFVFKRQAAGGTGQLELVTFTPGG